MLRESGGMESPVMRVSETACRELRNVRDAENLDEAAVRVKVTEEGAAFRYEFGFVPAEAKQETDSVVDAAGVPIYVDPDSASRLLGATLEYIDDLSGRGFRFDNPNRPRLLENPLAARVQNLLDERINPMVAAHGGRVALMDVEGDRVVLRFGGGCQGCGMVDVTLKQGVEAILKQEIAEIREVLDVTDHAAGANPYYRAPP